MVCEKQGKSGKTQHLSRISLKFNCQVKIINPGRENCQDACSAECATQILLQTALLTRKRFSEKTNSCFYK